MPPLDRQRRLGPVMRRRMRGKPCRIRAVEQARLYLGVKEHPAGTNRGPHIDRWCKWANGLTGYPWCAAFTCGMVREICGLIVPEPKRAAVGFLEQWASRVGSLVEEGTRVRRGDWIVYRFDTDDWPDHIGIVLRVYAVRWRGRYAWGRVKTIEGNTSAGDDANGGEVQIRYRDITRAKFIRVDAKKLTDL